MADRTHATPRAGNDPQGVDKDDDDGQDDDSANIQLCGAVLRRQLRTHLRLFLLCCCDWKAEPPLVWVLLADELTVGHAQSDDLVVCRSRGSLRRLYLAVEFEPVDPGQQTRPEGAEPTAVGFQAFHLASPP